MLVIYKISIYTLFIFTFPTVPRPQIRLTTTSKAQISHVFIDAPKLISSCIKTLWRSIVIITLKINWLKTWIIEYSACLSTSRHLKWLFLSLIFETHCQIFLSLIDFLSYGSKQFVSPWFILVLLLLFNFDRLLENRCLNHGHSLRLCWHEHRLIHSLSFLSSPFHNHLQIWFLG